ncbi:translation initiation factor IF3-1, mitochondrial-like [Bidens hawaiensis]|uniref:translation initiation factor IF3-1, mitochondrial-like n=1 Tax=Bidens hawaiensis TaxID=980011 RepID=UPI00404976BB
MVLFWCRTKQAQLRVLSNQFKRCYFQIHESSSVIRETKIGVVNGQGLSFHRPGPELGNSVRFFAAPVQAKPKYEEKDKGGPRMNSQIHAQYVRLVTDEGHSVVPRNEALERAKKLNLDLVEVQPDGNPPVCKLMDYKKEMYLKQVKEKEQTKKKSDLVLRKGGLKEIRITFKIDKHDMKTKADAIKRLAERGHRIKCMAVKVTNGKSEEQDLGGLLSRLSAMIDDFALVESGPRVEEKQAYVVVRHIKFGPLKKGPAKKKVSEMVNDISTQSSEEQSLNESDSETDTYHEKEMELDSTDDSDHVVKPAPETFNRYAPTRQPNGSENRYATTRPTNGPGQSQSQNVNKRGPGEAASGYGRFDAPRPNSGHRTESGPVEVNRYMKGPASFGRENNNMNPGVGQGKTRWL